MNIRTATRLALSCAVALISVATTSLTRASAQVDYATFVQRFGDAIRLNDERGLDRLVRESPHNGIEHFEALFRETFKRGDDATLKASLTALKGSYKRVFESEVLEKHERYLSGLGTGEFTTLDSLRNSLNQLYNLKAQATTNRDRPQFEKLAGNATELARKYEQVHHALKAAETWAVASELWSNIPEPTVDTQRDAVFAMEQYELQRKNLGFTSDPEAVRNLNWLKYEKQKVLEAEKERQRRKDAGYDENAKGADAFVMPGATEEIAPLEFKALAQPQDDMFVRGGPVPALWLSTHVVDGGPSEVGLFKRSRIFLVWDGGSKYGVTENGGEADLRKNKYEPISAASGKSMKPSVFHLGANKEPYAMWFYLPGESEPVLGLNQNLAPREKTDTSARTAYMYYRSASSWVAQIGGETVTFYDDNSDGILFQEDPMAHNVWDRSLGKPDENGTIVPAYDSMRIGKGPLQPFSSYVQIAGKWYHLRPHEDGKKVGIRALNPEFFKTGQITFKWNGPAPAKPQFLIVRGRGSFASAHFNVATGKPVDVPAGDYEITFGRIVEGKGANIATAAIFKGDSELVKVEAGKATALAIGAPFTIDFVRKGNESEVEIESIRFRVKGALGELYTRLNNATIAPEVMVAKAADGKGAKAIGEFVAITDPEMLNSVATRLRNEKIDLGLEAALFPVVKGEKDGATTFKAKLPAAGMLVGLQQKKHRLFGKLDPVWK